MSAPLQPDRKPRHLKIVPETVRERETFKYYPTPAAAIPNATGAPIDTSRLSSCDDAVLTALAQAGTFQTGMDRSLISLFDCDNQYIVAEATRSSRLISSMKSVDCTQQLWLCGTSIPRNHGVCELALLGEAAATQNEIRTDSTSSDPRTELPLTIANDLVLDPRFCDKPYCQPGTLCRFYAAVPIRTQRGINIGVFCVIKETPGADWSDQHTQSMRDTSHTIMAYLESKRLGILHRRNERMNRGLGSFIQGQSTVSAWQSGPLPAALANDTRVEGALDSTQQSVQLQQEQIRDAGQLRGETTLNDTASSTRALPDQLHLVPGVTSQSERPFQTMAANLSSESSSAIFSKAANIMREATEVEGCVFVDAIVDTVRSRSARNVDNDPAELFTLTSSSDEGADTTSPAQSWRQCRVLGYSTSQKSSINQDTSPQLAMALPKRFLAELLQRYPKGKIYNFGTDGVLQPSDQSEDDGLSSSSDVSPNGREGLSAIPTHNRPQRKLWSHDYEGSILLKTFPGARSIAFTPVWDPRRDRWYASGFIYTNLPTRSFTVEGELSYLRAFGMLTMAEILRIKDQMSDKAKSDILGSLSHELRSPLHGIILSAELLSDTRLDVFQGNAAHTIEVCSRTLLDTIDHLLDYSKINNFPRQISRPKLNTRARHVSVVDDPAQFGERSVSSDTQVDRLVEEVAESVFAGYTFQYLSGNQSSTAEDTGVVAKRSGTLPRSQSSDLQIALRPAQTPAAVALSQQVGQVAVTLAIDACQNWSYHVQVGALRRIVMNLFGNALKYTSRGTIKVLVTQERRSIHGRKKQQVVKLVVEDTGKGIGPDFLQHGLFQPFSQEDNLTPGTGLGLSLVKQIVSQLRGEVAVKSQVGVGTVVSVFLPLEQAQQGPSQGLLPGSETDRLFANQIRDLKGLRIGLRLSAPGQQDIFSDRGQSVADICRDWLTMELVDDASGPTAADVLLWSHEALPALSSDISQLSKTPNVVICSNPLVAYRETKAHEAAEHGAIIEFISQPIGPRKLARTLLLAYTRWMELSDLQSPAAIANISSLAVPNRPGAPQRTQSSFTVTNNRPSTSRPTAARVSSFAPSTATNSPDDDSTSIFSEVKDDGDDETEVTSATPIESPTSEPEDPVSKFLLVDDNHINLKLLAAFMGKLGLDYDTAVNGQEAVDLFCQPGHVYSCILMDISMPVMDGFEATRCIRARESRQGLPPVPIIALSGLASDDAQNEAIGSGMDMLLTKPVKLKALGSILESRGILKI